MSIVEHLYAPSAERLLPNAAIDAANHKDRVIALRRRAAGSSFFSAMQLLPVQRRRAMRALHAFFREVDDIADGDASRSLKQILLANWRSEIALLFAGRPQHDVTRGLREAYISTVCGVRIFSPSLMAWLRGPTFGRRALHSSIAIASAWPSQLAG